MNLHTTFAVIARNIATMREEPHRDSEQVSQAILGDIATYLSEQEEFVRLRTPDGYEGWVCREDVRILPAIDSTDRGASPSFASRLPPWPFLSEHSDNAEPGDVRYVCAGIADLYEQPGEPWIPMTKLVLGTWLNVIDRVDESTQMLAVEVPFNRTEEAYRELGSRDGESANAQSGHATPVTVQSVCVSAYVNVRDTACAHGYRYGREFSGASVCALSLTFVGTPYLWGGGTPFGFDCSGFVQRMYAMHNVTIPRDAYLQARSVLGGGVASGQALEPGDLVFFCSCHDPRGRGITHVGIALDADRFVHASGRHGVVVTRFADPSCSSAYPYVGAWRYALSARYDPRRV